MVEVSSEDMKKDRRVRHIGVLERAASENGPYSLSWIWRKVKVKQTNEQKKARAVNGVNAYMCLKYGNGMSN